MTSELTPQQRSANTLQLIERCGLDKARYMVGVSQSEIGKFIDVSLLSRPTETCRHCGYPIATLRGRWTHTDENGLPLGSGRKCHSAALTRMPEARDYDPGLDKKLSAAALPGVHRPKE